MTWPDERAAAALARPRTAGRRGSPAHWTGSAEDAPGEAPMPASDRPRATRPGSRRSAARSRSEPSTATRCSETPLARACAAELSTARATGRSSVRGPRARRTSSRLRRRERSRARSARRRAPSARSTSLGATAERPRGRAASGAVERRCRTVRISSESRRTSTSGSTSGAGLQAALDGRTRPSSSRPRLVAPPVAADRGTVPPAQPAGTAVAAEARAEPSRRRDVLSPTARRDATGAKTAAARAPTGVRSGRRAGALAACSCKRLLGASRPSTRRSYAPRPLRGAAVAATRRRR